MKVNLEDVNIGDVVIGKKFATEYEVMGIVSNVEPVSKGSWASVEVCEPLIVKEFYLETPKDAVWLSDSSIELVGKTVEEFRFLKHITVRTLELKKMVATTERQIKVSTTIFDKLIEEYEESYQTTVKLLEEFLND